MLERAVLAPGVERYIQGVRKKTLDKAVRWSRRQQRP